MGFIIDKVNAKAKILKFSCPFCEYYAYTKKESVKHIEQKHQRLLKQYETMHDYDEAVRKGIETECKTQRIKPGEKEL